MPKLPVISGRELLTSLKKAGFVEGTLLDILHQTGLSKDDLLKLL